MEEEPTKQDWRNELIEEGLSPFQKFILYGIVILSFIGIVFLVAMGIIK